MQIEVIPEHALSTATDAAIGTLMDTAFGAGAQYEGRSFHKMRHHVRVVGWQEGQVIGHVGVQLRAIRAGTTPLTIAAIGEVAVHPNHQGNGMGSALMRQAIETAKDTVSSFAMLFGHPGLYAPLGFRNQPNRLTYVSWKNHAPCDVVTGTIESLMVLPLGSTQWDETAEIDLCGPLF
ncbi:GNAT family N-acetyltransferase [Nioella aestuarii]|uniref:GNAT family N-acetyltransferase n=1 Tax=Nioella aestuarii TaxID=1662864 RepID=UPI003D7F8DE2